MGSRRSPPRDSNSTLAVQEQLSLEVTCAKALGGGARERLGDPVMARVAKKEQFAGGGGRPPRFILQRRTGDFGKLAALLFEAVQCNTSTRCAGWARSSRPSA